MIKKNKIQSYREKNKLLEEDTNMLEKELKIIESFKNKEEKEVSNNPTSSTYRPISFTERSKVTNTNDTVKKNEILRKAYEEKIKHKEIDKLEKLQAKLLGKSKNLISDNSLSIQSKTNKELLKPLSQKGLEKLINKDQVVINKNEELAEIRNKENNELTVSKQIIKDEETLEKEYFPSLKAEKKKDIIMKYRDIFDLLKSIKLSRYIDIFIDEGFDNLDIFLEIKESFLVGAGFDKDKTERILDKINEIKEMNMRNLEIEQLNSQINKLDHQPIREAIKIEESITTNEMNLLPFNKPKVSCYYCMKINLLESVIIKHYDLGLIKEKVVMYIF